MDKLSKTERILSVIDGGLSEAGTSPDAVAAVEGSVLSELEEDERLGFITTDEKELIFSAWRNRYRPGIIVHTNNNPITEHPDIIA